MNAAAIRAPRLTDNRLADLQLVTEALGAEIQYLAEAYPTYPPTSELHLKLKARHDALARGRDYIVGKINAERAHRAEAVAS